MIKNTFYSVVACLASQVLVCSSFAADTPAVTKVACVGDSITFGAGIKNRGLNNYPAQLGRVLGDKYEVRNFGVNGATMLKKGNKPYWNQGAYKKALAYQPDMVIIKLGTNDSKPGNWAKKADFASNTIEMIQSFRNLKSNPTVWICYPVPAYQERWGISDKTIKNEVLPLVAQAATQTTVKVIDLYKALSDKASLFPDKIHPNAEGAKIIADTIAAVITGKPGAKKTAPRTNKSTKGKLIPSH